MRLTLADGTLIGYRQVGRGPGVVLLHGGMQSSQHLMPLATALSDDFTVTVPDRRGRGLSGPVGPGHGLRTEAEDLRALLRLTGAHNVFGLSVGGVIALEAAALGPEIKKLAVYEPPLPFPGIAPDDWVPRYERELADGRLAAAFVSVIKGTGDAVGMRLVPRVLLTPLMALALRADARTHETDAVPVRELIPTMRDEAKTIVDSERAVAGFGAVRCEVLLLGGTRSAPNLKAALVRLAAVLPGARRVTLRGVGHTGADDLVGRELRGFFSEVGP